MAKPKTKAELFLFYSNTLKPLYAAIQSENELPPEVLFEIHAALDHLSREYTYGEAEDEVVEKAYSHFKRACLDVFKLTVKRTIDHYNELARLDLSVLDNGQFEAEMRSLISKIKDGARKARCNEGVPNQGATNDSAFDLWEPVYTQCDEFDMKFYRHQQLDWARKKMSWFSWRSLVVGALLGGVISWGISRGLDWLFPATGI
ncbi:MAG: hypothetical protein ACFCUX_07920 [Candidatus Methylacidiphilales bacterium]